jgi:aldehyde:ferredoxin oxidoreductase
MKLHMLCDDLGMDEDSAASSIAWAMECYERGILTKEETGMELPWGDFDIISALMEKIAKREGFGKILSHGSKQAAEILGKGDRYAMHIKGQDLYEHLRTMKGWALGVAVSTRGGGHTSGAPMTEFMALDPAVAKEQWGIGSAGDPRSYKDKAALVVYYEILHAVVNSLGVCLFVTDWSGPGLLTLDDFSALLTHASGVSFTGNDLTAIGERIVNVEKAFNTLHAGFTRKDDYPPERFFTEKVSSGPLKGERLHRKEWDHMLDQYYDIHGWDKDTSLQKRSKLEKLGLTEVSDKLARENLLVK